MMKALAYLAAILVLGSCGSVGRSSGGGSSPTASSSRTMSSPRQESPIPSASPIRLLPPVARAPFPSCRLSYIKPASMGFGGPPFSGGFVSGQRGLWTADPAGGISKVGDLLVTAQTPTLTGSGFGSSDSGSYDLAARRWLPVRGSQVRSDGLAYAYAEPSKANSTDSLNSATRVHVVSLTDGSDRVIYSGAPRAVLAYESDGIYVTSVRYYSGEGGGGLWRLDPLTGASIQIPNVQAGWIEAFSNGIGWTDGGTIMPRGLIRTDLGTGSQETWASVGDNAWIWFVGLDGNGHPLLTEFPIPLTSASPVLYVYTTAADRTAIADGSFKQMTVSDSRGTWLAGEDGIYLLDANDRLVKVSDVTGGTVAGGCN